MTASLGRSVVWIISPHDGQGVGVVSDGNGNDDRRQPELGLKANCSNDDGIGSGEGPVW